MTLHSEIRGRAGFEWRRVRRVRLYWINGRTLQVHFDGCPSFPDVNEVCLGYFGSLGEAVDFAVSDSPKADWCDHCLDREMDMADQLGWFWQRFPIRLPPHQG